VQCRLCFFLIPLNRVAPSPAPPEKARPAALVRAAKPDAKRALSFRPRSQRTHGTPFSLKQLCCPECGAAETLNCHSKLYGNDPSSTDGQDRVQRGQRVWCSHRGQRGGCGRSFAIFLADVLPRHTVTGPWLWRLLDRLLAGGSIKAVAEALGLPFALETVYHLLHRLRQRLARVRSALCREQKPPASSQTDPLLQTAEHLQSLFPRSVCPPGDFQLRFQCPLLESEAAVSVFPRPTDAGVPVGHLTFAGVGPPTQGAA